MRKGVSHLVSFAVENRTCSLSVILGLLYIITFAVLWKGEFEQALSSALLLPVLIWLSVVDIQDLRLPSLGNLAVAVIGTALLCIYKPSEIRSYLAAAAVTYVFFWCVGELYFLRKGAEGLGIGDAKLFAAGVIVLGPFRIPELILISSLGGIIGYVLRSFRHGAGASGIPFGPYIAYAIYVLNFSDPVFL